MSYTVLARKYRPQSFDELVGQEHVAKTIANAIAQGRVAHARARVRAPEPCPRAPEN